MSCVSESRIPVGDWAKFNLELEKKIWGGGGGGGQSLHMRKY